MAYTVTTDEIYASVVTSLHMINLTHAVDVRVVDKVPSRSQSGQRHDCGDDNYAVHVQFVAKY